MRVSELSGVELDYWVGRVVCEDGDENADMLPEAIRLGDHRYSSDWALCGPLVERFRIDLLNRSYEGDDAEVWEANTNPPTYTDDRDCVPLSFMAPTPQVAICRAIVASVYGEEVPDA